MFHEYVVKNNKNLGNIFIRNSENEPVQAPPLAFALITYSRALLVAS